MHVRKPLSTAVLLSLLASLLALAPVGVAGAQSADLLISEYIEGSSFNKAIEIYNGTGADVDLTAYSLELYSNGRAMAAGPSATMTLSDTLADGDVAVYAHPSADPAILAVADGTNGSVINFNGDDSLILRTAAGVIDSFGRNGEDPGTAWTGGGLSTANSTLVRQADVCTGDTTIDDPFDPSVEYEGFARDTFDQLGTHTATCGGGANASPQVTSTPATLELDEGEAGSAEITATDSDGTVASLEVTDPDPLPAGITYAGDADSGTLTVSDSVAAGEYVITYTATDDEGATGTATTTVTVIPPPQPMPISAVQGAGEESPVLGDRVIIDGIVTSLFERNDVLDGFFVQEPTPSDADPTTSEGVFVFCRVYCDDVDLAVGDEVEVTGTVGEFFGMTQVNVSTGFGSIETLSTGNAIPAATAISLPASGPTNAEGTFESVEGMVVTVEHTLAVSEYFQLARFGLLVLHNETRPYQYTHDNLPSVEGYAAFLEDLAANRIILDDDNNDNNDAIGGPDADEPYPYPSPGLSIDNYIRGGDTIDGLTGVMHWSFSGSRGTDAWRLRPIQDGREYTFDRTNPRTDAPEPVGGDLRVASFNVLNYFTTIDETASRSSGPCGPSGEMDCRGADSVAEFERQQAKIVAALVAIDADVVGLIEIENNATAVQNLVDALNAATAPGTYAQVDTGPIGTDAIKVGFIYKPASVTPVGDYAILDSTVDPRFVDTKNRPTLIQTFEEVATGERFTAAINHLKSKGSDCDELEDESIVDGQANCSETRLRAAEALADYLATDPTDSGDPDVIILGDLNAYRMEDAIRALEDAGYTDLIERFVGDDAYGYLFDGQLGYLDHALANMALLPQVTGATEWHINADEVPLLDYNDDIHDAPGEAFFERESSALPLYEPNPYRSSDHDAVIVGLDLGVPTADAGGPYEVRVGRHITFDATAATPTMHASRPPGEYVVSVEVTDEDGQTDTASATLTVTTGNGSVPPGRAPHHLRCDWIL